MTNKKIPSKTKVKPKAKAKPKGKPAAKKKTVPKKPFRTGGYLEGFKTIRRKPRDA